MPPEENHNLLSAFDRVEEGVASAEISYESTDHTNNSGGAGTGESFENDVNHVHHVAWLILLAAILLEVMGTTCMKLSEGFTKLLPSVAIYIFYAASFTLFPSALNYGGVGIDLSTAYGVWSGLGTTLTSIIGFIYFGDSLSWTKTMALTSIIVGCITLKIAA
mmetsp:Transcript_25347/g.31234  ORF Transcript_25347/g.31234 Transcript_25347/m.31234 type:complete len:163 (-) Transcript_25347:446-934(-)